MSSHFYNHCHHLGAKNTLFYHRTSFFHRKRNLHLIKISHSACDVWQTAVKEQATEEFQAMTLEQLSALKAYDDDYEKDQPRGVRYSNKKKTLILRN